MAGRSPEIEAMGKALAKRLVERAERRQRDLRERRDALRAEARRLSERLVREYGATAVWLIGSLAGEGGLVHARSDIDIVVAGLPDADAWSLAGALEEEAGVPVDVVILERAPDSFRATLEEIGERLDVSPS